MDEHFPIFGDEPSTTTPAVLDHKVEPPQRWKSAPNFGNTPWGCFGPKPWEKVATSTGDRRMIHPSTVWLGILKFPHLQMVVIGSLHPHSPPCLCLSCLFTSTETTIEADHVWKDPEKVPSNSWSTWLSYRFPVIQHIWSGRWFNTKPILQDKSKKIRFAGGLYFPKSAAGITGVGSLFLTKPNSAMFKWEMLEHYHGFALFDPPKMGKLMNPGLSNEWIERTKTHHQYHPQAAITTTGFSYWLDIFQILKSDTEKL